MPRTSAKTKPYGTVKFPDIDAYHASFPPNIQKILQQLRQAIHQAAPEATETISYNMPAFKQHQVLVYYAAYNNHIGFYPTPAPILVFKDKLIGYKTSKGAIQFPLNEPLPLALIKEIVRYRLQHNAEKKAQRQGAKA